MYLSKISYLMFMFITGCVNHFGFDILFGFLLLCIKQWLERVVVPPPPKAIFRTVEAIFMKDIFIMLRAFLEVGYLYKGLNCQFDFSACKSSFYKSNRRYFGVF